MSAKKFFLPLLLAGAALACAFRRSDKPAAIKSGSNRGPYDAIEAYIEAQMRRLHIPGLSLAIVAGDQIVYQRGFGRARPGGAAPTPQTPFVLGSTTKSITALAVMQLVEAGKIELDAPVQRYLPWFRVADLQASAEVTVRHLLNQTSGLPELPGLLPLSDFDEHPCAAERQARRVLATLRLVHPAGTACEYSNLNYNLLGLIIAAASGETYAEIIQNRIFRPLGMSHSYTAPEAARQNGLAMGHRYWFAAPVAEPNFPIPRGSLPSGQLISCSEDMARYLIAHLNGGRCGGTQLLSGAGMAELHRGAAEYSKFGFSAGRYGMGWFNTGPGPTQILWHGGNVPDFSSFMALLPEQKKGVILLVNADHYGLPPVLAEVGLGVAALLAGRQPAPSRLGFLPWVMRALLLIPFLQILGAVATLRRLRRWREDPQRRPGQGSAWGRHILLPLIPNLLLAAAPVYAQSRRILAFMQLFMPDAACLALVCGGFAWIWTLLRTGLTLRILRKTA